VSGLPDGVVTFLFSDIEGSTRLVKVLRDRYPQVLAEHRRLVRAAVAAHGGREVDTAGDGLDPLKLRLGGWRTEDTNAIG
jgi:class 3 adenylate cyclase